MFDSKRNISLCIYLTDLLFKSFFSMITIIFTSIQPLVFITIIVIVISSIMFILTFRHTTMFIIIITVSIIRFVNSPFTLLICEYQPLNFSLNKQFFFVYEKAKVGKRFFICTYHCLVYLLTLFFFLFLELIHNNLIVFL